MSRQVHLDVSSHALELHNLSAFYGPVAAVRNVSVRIDKGTAVGVLGPNGAGKSTLLLALAGFLRTTGDITIGDRSIRRAGPAKRRRSGIVVVPQERAVIASLSVRENLRLAWLTGRRTETYEILSRDTLEIFPALRDRTHEPAGNLSGGQRQMLAVSRGLMSAPDVLMLDEPTAGLAPKFISELAEAFNELRIRGLTLLLVEQNFSVVQRTCDYIHVLNGGQITWEGQTDAIDRETVGNLYAGSGNN